ncbi:MAG: leucyl aminopeptidase [Candidatus Poseidoniia archaeon]|jgi:leucyl aminopeptidase|nr:leucyl aminopeptidase [Candidatus Poseidoniia archaeon]MDP6658946.1 leucyl aminopeptidase [Candidatus Poseidoniia archaeon]MDP7006726.1 leucyl aminopeptidase [Candidatus Poseidoniia archaeon]|tara:strand:+ start:3263 stop:4687 length:1425 start_codon:yes stop_codon:yes gene_type:complete
MKLEFDDGKLSAVAADALAVPVFKDEAPDAVGALVAPLREAGELKGKPGELTLLHAPDGFAARRLLLIGCGDDWSTEAAFAFGGQAVRAANGRGYHRLALALEGDAHSAVAGAVAGGFGLEQYRLEQDDSTLEALVVCGPRDGAEAGFVVGECANVARELASLPANELGPEEFAARAAAEGPAHGLAVNVMGEAELRAMGAGALCSVADGSARPPQLVRLDWSPGEAPKRVHLWLVGKGITFDTGGISIKPSKNMQKMKYDMSGAACMYGAITAIARLKVPLRVTALLALAENMPSGTATRPGDIVRAMNGKHVEVDNTDAEGRLVLADALCYAVAEGATHIIDSATLTGAVIYALGSTRAAVMANDDALAGRVMAAGDAAGERYWQLPMDAEYGKLMKGELADLKNVSGTPEAGTVTAAKFLEEFVDGTPWVHLDIAGTAWDNKGRPHLRKGPTGITVRTLVQLAETWAAEAR